MEHVLPIVWNNGVMFYLTTFFLVFVPYAVIQAQREEPSSFFTFDCFKEAGLFELFALLVCWTFCFVQESARVEWSGASWIWLIPLFFLGCVFHLAVFRHAQKHGSKKRLTII